MLSMTVETPYSGIGMCLSHGSNENLGLMTRATTRLHVARHRMARQTGTRIWSFCDGGSQEETRPGVRVRDRRGGIGGCVPISSRNRQDPYRYNRPDENRERPRTHEIPRRRPVKPGLPQSRWLMRMKS